MCLIQKLESNSPPTESEGGEWYLTFVALGTEAEQHHPVCKRCLSIYMPPAVPPRYRLAQGLCIYGPLAVPPRYRLAQSLSIFMLVDHQYCALFTQGLAMIMVSAFL